MSDIELTTHTLTVTGPTPDLGVLTTPGGYWRYQPTEHTTTWHFGRLDGITLRGRLIRKDGTPGVDRREVTYTDPPSDSKWAGLIDDIPGLRDLVNQITAEAS